MLQAINREKLDIWRSERDSNSRTAFDGYTLSRRASSATRASLLCKWFAAAKVGIFWLSAMDNRIFFVFDLCIALVGMGQMGILGRACLARSEKMATFAGLLTKFIIAREQADQDMD